MKLRPYKMKLSDKTLTLLKNFSTINQSILFKKGSSLRTISVMKNILAEAEITEEIPKDFGIYDLNQFLNGLDLHRVSGTPELDFTNDGYVIISDGSNESKYFFADANVIVTPPEKDITLPSEEVKFNLSIQQLDKLLRGAAVYQLSDLSVIGRNGAIKLVARDKKNDTSNNFSITVGETDHEFSFNYKVENIKIPCDAAAVKNLPHDYEVVVASKGNLISRFRSKNGDLTYYIALEPDSTFG